MALSFNGHRVNAWYGGKSPFGRVKMVVY